MWLTVNYQKDLHIIDLLYDVQHDLGIVLKIIADTYGFGKYFNFK